MAYPREVFDIFDEQVDAFNARDLERFVACYARDATVLTATGVLTGHDELRAAYRTRFTDPQLSCEVMGVAPVSEDWIEASERVRSGEGERQVRALFEVKQGAITRAALFPAHRPAER